MSGDLVGLVLALVVGYGVFLLYTAVAFGWRGIGVSPGLGGRRRGSLQDFLVQAGLDGVRPVELLAVEVVLVAVAAAFGFAVYGGLPAAAAAGLAAGTVPVASARARRRSRRELAREAWPRMIEQIRMQAVTLGRSIPQALFDAGFAGPQELRPAFEAAHREWLVSADVDRTLRVLKAGLADPTADAVCETLLVAHEVGGTDVDQRLRALMDDRLEDLQGRKDARAKQAGVRFARWFVIVVPVGMALVGLNIGEGRAAYDSTGAQAAVLAAFAMMAGCWFWAAQLLKLPQERRVLFDEPARGGR
ncbi:MAG: type II secretion system F family protein [Actinomycetota bacterium]